MTDRPTVDLSAIGAPGSWDAVARGYEEHLAGLLAAHARDAIELAEVCDGERVLDVATGPGTLAIQAARITHVDALDFSADMLASLAARAANAGVERLTLHQGDGQALPFTADTFDVAFSMFGLFLFPDRAAAFSELARVVRPGGRVVVSSWQPEMQAGALRVIGEALWVEAGVEPTEPPPNGPLSDPEAFRAEMTKAGFDVAVHPCVHHFDVPSTASMWEGFERAHVGLATARAQLPTDRFDALAGRIERRLYEELGDGPQRLVMPAWLALGRR